MIRNFKRTAAVFGVVAVSSAALVACGDSSESTDSADSSAEASAESTDGAEGTGAELSGETGQLVAEGATSQQNAMDYFASRYAEEVPGATLAYNATGSGSGIKQFLGNTVAFAGSDSPLKDEEVEKAAERCGGNEAWHLPFVIGPVAIAYNLEGVDELNLTVDNIVDIFQGKITNWNDPALAESNPDAELPDQEIKPFFRSDESGTSDNFQKFLAAASDGKWTGEGKAFPSEVGTGANGSSGVASEVAATEGAITYVEAGFAEKKANIDFGSGPVELTDEAVAAALDSMEFTTEGHNMAVDAEALFSSDAEGAYPLVLTTYEIVCSKGYDDQTRDLVKNLMYTILDNQGDDLANSGYIPVEGEFKSKLEKAVEALS